MEKVNTILADLGMFILVVLLAMYTSGCTFHVGFDYAGQTAKSDHTYTPGKK